MRNVLVVILFAFSATLSATTYYIDPNGDNRNFGTKFLPWKTLAYACSKVTASGDIIYVNPGIYYEVSQSLLAPGVSIEGSGLTSVIKSHVKGMSTIILSSSTQGSDGNQHISYIKMDGDQLTGHMPVLVERRKNVSIHDCTFIDFSHDGVYFCGNAWGVETAPLVYATGNSFHSNTVINCAGYMSGIGGFGNLRIEGQQDISIYDNSFTANQRPQGSNGCGLKSFHTKGMKIYNNIFTTDQTLGYNKSNSYNFAIELWDGSGTEIYDNRIYGTVDIGGHNQTRGAYPFSVSIHNNFIGSKESTSVYLMAIDLESDQNCEDVLIYNNIIKNVNRGIIFLPTNSATYNRIKVYYNIFDQIGHNETGWGTSPAYAFSTGSGTARSITNFYFCNNVFNMSAYPGALHGNAIEIPSKTGVSVSNFYIQNNIIIGCDAPAVESKKTGTIENLRITNNIFFKNGYSNEPVVHVPATNYTAVNNLKLDPLFVSTSDFHLQAESPAIGKGVKIDGLTNDHDGKIVNDPPCIGAYEYSAVNEPVYQNSSTEDLTPDVLDIYYNLTLADITPSTDAFNVEVNSNRVEVISIVISGNKVQLAINATIKYCDVVTVSYTKPEINALQTSAGGEAGSISLKLVKNNCSDRSISDIIKPISINIYPNPANNFFYIESSEDLNSITIIGLSGSVVYKDSLNLGLNKIQIPESLFSGLYLVELRSGAIIMDSQKLIINR